LIAIKSQLGYDTIFSKKLQENIYFIKHRGVQVPDAKLAKYLPKEIALIGKVDLDELKLINDAKKIFNGMLIK
tara:strand:- start:4673 stop:4891 length:219 start_codon:yes stop_codon:yes gene_type:complete